MKHFPFAKVVSCNKSFDPQSEGPLFDFQFAPPLRPTCKDSFISDITLVLREKSTLVYVRPLATDKCRGSHIYSTLPGRYERDHAGRV